MAHIPVLLNEVIRLLAPKPDEIFIDGTFGSGGHAKAILEKIGQGGKLLLVDWDEENLIKNRLPAAKNIIAVNDNYADLPAILKKHHFPKADGLLLDLGFSSEQLEKSGRGFSFRRNEPLIMTYSKNSRPVYQLIQELDELELAEILKKFGEERYARRIAKAIAGKKEIQTSGELAAIVAEAVPKTYEKRIHPAARTFQALRIYANQELENLEKILGRLREVLKSGGRAAIISFHSLEDRLVKNYFRDLVKTGQAALLTKKPVTPDPEEISRNPRSRSAKLRSIKII